MINGFEVACPDGHPVRIAMNHLCGAGLEDRVCGPDTCEILLLKASQQGISVFFYGSTPQTLEALEKNVLLRWPQLKIAGTHSPPFRPLTPGEEDEVANRINASGAGLVFIGLGAPRQSIFAARMQEKIHAGMLCVGAAFDFLAKTKRRAPQWMQKSGMEWFYRLVQEPRRLARRYTLTNSLFLLLLLRASLTGSRS
jgi:exopolysaccharide biosynthesis WecB/TagA/CpsF family protein